MERVMTPEERIKRAEEIYYRRKNQLGVRVSTTSVNVGKKNRVSLGKKMIIQLLICTCIYAVIFFIKDKESYFSKQTIETVSNVLNYDVNLVDVYNGFIDYVKSNKIFENVNIKSDVEVDSNEENSIEGDNSNNTNITEDNSNNENDNSNIENTNNSEVNDNSTSVETNNSEIDENNNIESTNNSDVSENTENAVIQNQENSNDQVQEKSQMEIDADYIKQNFNIIKPVNGHITSGFGNREPTEIISAFHQGVDISSEQGTSISAAMEGTVVASSYAGDYGNHIKIQNGDVLTVYAHCSELDVAVGDYVYQNQIIGKVGATR